MTVLLIRLAMTIMYDVHNGHRYIVRGDNSNCTNINHSDISNIETLLNMQSNDISYIKQVLEKSVLVKDSIVSYSDMLKKSTKSIDSIKTNIDIINKTNTYVSIYAARKCI